jgi:hypothetical protein
MMTLGEKLERLRQCSESIARESEYRRRSKRDHWEEKWTASIDKTTDCRDRLIADIRKYIRQNDCFYVHDLGLKKNMMNDILEPLIALDRCITMYPPDGGGHGHKHIEGINRKPEKIAIFEDKY